MKRLLRPAIIGKDGRTSAIERSLRESARVAAPPLRLSDWKGATSAALKANVLQQARESRPDFVFIGPEDPLAHGVADALQALGIPSIGPTQSLARLETSKAFTRQLLAQHHIPGNPAYAVFRTTDGIRDYLQELSEFVIKPDGLTGGKGVKLSGAHLASIDEAVNYCAELLSHGHQAVVVEEKLEGEEFSLQSFCDGTHVVDMVIVQDHKRVGEGDTGPNTGGMGSYSCEDHSLPFLQTAHVQQARAINQAVAAALLSETGQKYKGILYGGFMATADGIRLLEYNARFGDPETLNVLPLLQTDLVEICEAIIEERLDQLPVRFASLATVCKYVVPEGYPDHPVKGQRINLSKVPRESGQLKVYAASVDERNGELYLGGSRAMAFVGLGKELEQAQAIAETAACAVAGPVFHRRDIGTRDLIQRRITHMRELLNHGRTTRKNR